MATKKKLRKVWYHCVYTFIVFGAALISVINAVTVTFREIAILFLIFTAWSNNQVFLKVLLLGLKKQKKQQKNGIDAFQSFTSQLTFSHYHSCVIL